MSSKKANFEELEEKSARNFIKLIRKTNARQIIYLGGITNEDKLSRHLASRKRVEGILSEDSTPLTAIRAGIIVGSGSASFEIIRDLVEKLPVMITPKWLKTKCQPIAIRNVLEYLSGVLLREDTYDQAYDIGGPDILTYKEMLLKFGEVRGLKRWIWTVPVMTPRLSSYWLYFVTSTSYKLAVNLVDSMKVEVISRDKRLEELLDIHPIHYKKAVEMAFQKIEQDDVVSSWKDSFSSSRMATSLLEHAHVPTSGCFTDKRLKAIKGNPDQVLKLSLIHI